MEKREILKRQLSKGKRLSEEFKNFAFKDSTISMAIGIMVGASLSSVINSLVNDILTPPIAYLTSGIDFSNLFIAFGSETYDTLEKAKEAGAVVIQYGNFINTFISFIITAFVLFLVVYKTSQAILKKSKKEEKNTKDCPYCMSSINIKATRCPNCTSKLD